MFDPTSRYYALETATRTVQRDDATREVRYVRRRFIPPADTQTTLVEHTVVEGERLDVITARYLGDPTQFWRVCDANHAMHPSDLTEEPGTVIDIALPQS